MFKVSRRLDYGLQLMIALAHNETNAPQATAVLSEQLHIPLPFLHQIGRALIQGGLIKATPGPARRTAPQPLCPRRSLSCISLKPSRAPSAWLPIPTEPAMAPPRARCGPTCSRSWSAYLGGITLSSLSSPLEIS